MTYAKYHAKEKEKERYIRRRDYFKKRHYPNGGSKYHKKGYNSNSALNLSREKHWHWKGGITPFINKVRHLEQNFKWRSNVFQRDNWTCQTCNIRSKEGTQVRLEAHHIKNFKEILEENNITNINEAINCKELWDIDNGVTLCNNCHQLTKQGNPNLNKNTLKGGIEENA